LHTIAVEARGAPGEAREPAIGGNSAESRVILIELIKLALDIVADLSPNGLLTWKVRSRPSTGDVTVICGPRYRMRGRPDSAVGKPSTRRIRPPHSAYQIVALNCSKKVSR
jgi:hypothetical protein